MINAPNQICEMQQGNQLYNMKLDLLREARFIRFSKGIHNHRVISNSVQNTRFNTFREREAEARSLRGESKFRPRKGKKSLCCTVSAIGLVILLHQYVAQFIKLTSSKPIIYLTILQF